MGEVADMMLEGQMCQWCGEILGNGDGFPVVCAACQREHGVNQFGDKPGEEQSVNVDPRDPRDIPCPNCKRKFRDPHGFAQHWRVKHGNEEEE